MPWEVVKRDDTLLGANQPYISISTNRITFNAVLSKLAQLDPSKRVTIYADPENRRLGFEFHTDLRENSRAVSRPKDTVATYCSVRGVMAQYDWVRSVAKLPSRKARRFFPEQEGKRWVIQLCPAFEMKKARESTDIPSDAVGIYRYVRDNGEVVYIGQGKIRERLNLQERQDWEFSVVEYSIVENADDRLKWEDFWLERFRENNNRLPLYNKISGKGQTG